MTLPLTPKQERLWRFIRSCERSPSLSEMAGALGYSAASKGAVHCLVRQLRRRGMVKQTPGQARSIVALDPAADLKTYPTEALQAELERRAAL